MSGAWIVAALSATTLLASRAPVAGAESGWSRVPASGIGGGTVDVASSPASLCQWVQPADPDAAATTAPDVGTVLPPDTAAAADGDTTYDGTAVRVRLTRDGVDTPLTTFDVEAGGAWGGTITLPTDAALTPGDYELFAKCVVDRPELDGVRSYDFDPLPFTVVEAPPPTTTVPVEIIPPVTVTNPVEVQGAQLSRPAATAGAAPAVANQRSAPAATLPNTGDGTLETALAGLGALVVGAGALWLGARHGRRHPSADLVD
jgi:LPXTG-motif cell wall-anchored protein